MAALLLPLPAVQFLGLAALLRRLRREPRAKDHGPRGHKALADLPSGEAASTSRDPWQRPLRRARLYRVLETRHQRSLWRAKTRN